jgi:hypothetical protein
MHFSTAAATVLALASNVAAQAQVFNHVSRDAQAQSANFVSRDAQAQSANLVSRDPQAQSFNHATRDAPAGLVAVPFGDVPVR